MYWVLSFIFLFARDTSLNHHFSGPGHQKQNSTIMSLRHIIKKPQPWKENCRFKWITANTWVHAVELLVALSHSCITSTFTTLVNTVKICSSLFLPLASSCLCVVCVDAKTPLGVGVFFVCSWKVNLFFLSKSVQHFACISKLLPRRLNWGQWTSHWNETVLLLVYFVLDLNPQGTCLSI